MHISNTIIVARVCPV